MGFRTNDLNWSFRKTPCNSCCEIFTGNQIHAAQATLDKYGVSEYLNEDEDEIKRFKIETFSLEWNVGYSFGGSTLDIEGSFSQTLTINDKTGAEVLEREGTATQVVTSGSTSTAIFNNSTGKWDIDFYEDSGWSDGAFDYSFSQPAVAKNLIVNDVIAAYNHHGSQQNSFWKVTAVTITQTSIVITGVVNNPTWSAAWSGSFTATWTLSEENTTENVSGLINTLLAGIDLSTFPFSEHYNDLGLAVSVGYGGCDGSPECLESFEDAVTDAEDLLDEKEEDLTDAETAETTALSELETAQSDYAVCLASWNTAKDNLTDANAEKAAAERNLATWQRRNDAAAIALAESRLVTAIAAQETATDDLATAQSDLDETFYPLEDKKRDVAEAKENVLKAEYQVAVATLKVSLMEQNETNAGIGEDQIIVTSIESFVLNTAEHSLFSSEQTTLKRKIRYRLWGNLTWLPKDEDSQTFEFDWREGTFGPSNSFEDKNEGGLTVSENEYANISYWYGRTVYSSPFDVSAPSANSEVRIIGEATSPNVIFDTATKGGLFQKMGIFSYIHDEPPKVYKTETIAGSLISGSNGVQQVETDGAEFSFSTDLAENNIYRTKVPVFDGTIGVDYHTEKSTSGISPTVKTFSDGTTATLSNEFTTAALEGYLSNMMDIGFQFTDEYYYYPMSYIYSPLPAFKVAPADGTVLGEKQLKYYHRIVFPDTYPLESLNGASFDAGFTVYEKNLLDGSVSESEETVSFTFEDPTFERTAYVPEGEEFILECETENTIKWTDQISCDFLSDYIYNPNVFCKIEESE